MSLEKYAFKYEDGEIVFLADVVSELTDNFSQEVAKVTNCWFMCIEADVYRAKNRTLEEAIKDRISKFLFGSQLSKEDYLIKETEIY